jgi:4-hydroxybutyryl-CoA dehydratase / vinylacetyl-CoA-Delta-isomerase
MPALKRRPDDPGGKDKRRYFIPMMTARQYEESLRELNLEVYMFGRRVNNVVDDPVIRPFMKAVAQTYELAHHAKHEAIMTVRSHLSGEKINRFTHIHQSIDDLVKKSKMGRLLGRETGCCFQRCVGMDALNTLSIVTFNIDQQQGTHYHQRFLHYLATVQEKDLVCDGAMTDPKGHRRLPPRQQPDPDQYLHVIEKKRQRDCGQRRQGPSDRRAQFSRNNCDADHFHAGGRYGLCGFFRTAQ